MSEQTPGTRTAPGSETSNPSAGDADTRLDAALRALPAAIEPARDLWPELDARLENSERDRADPSATVLRPTRWRRAAPVGLLAAAAALAFSWWLGPRGPEAGPRAGSEGPPALAQASPPAAEPAPVKPAQEFLLPEEATWRAAAAELSQAVALRDPALEARAPELDQVLEENLLLVDSAIDQSRAALEQDPGNSDLQDSLQYAYRQKIELLQHLHQLDA